MSVWEAIFKAFGNVSTVLGVLSLITAILLQRRRLPQQLDEMEDRLHSDALRLLSDHDKILAAQRRDIDEMSIQKDTLQRMVAELEQEARTHRIRFAAYHLYVDQCVRVIRNANLTVPDPEAAGIDWDE